MPNAKPKPRSEPATFNLLAIARECLDASMDQAHAAQRLTDYRPEPPEKRPTAWTTFDQLSPRQKALYGGYVLAKDRSNREMRANLARQARAEAALKAAGDSKAGALAIMLGDR